MRTGRMIGWSAGGMLLIGAAAWLMAPSADPVLAQLPRPVTKWAYLTLSIPGNGIQPTIESADLRFWGATWKAMADKLKLPVADGRSDADIRWLVLDHLGTQGWELTTHAYPPAGGELYTFKRPLP